MAKTEAIEIKPLNVKTAEITIVGDGDLILNKMNDVNAKDLIDKRKDKAKDTAKPNLWEAIITSMHWYNGKPTDFSEEGLAQALKENAPCITGFGLKKSFGQAVVQNKIDTYATKFNAGVNIIAKGDLVPIKFAEHYIDENLNRFSGWSAAFTIQYTENAFSIEQIVNIINLAGFGNGIGSGRNSGYGRYHVEGIR